LILVSDDGLPSEYQQCLSLVFLGSHHVREVIPNIHALKGFVAQRWFVHRRHDEGLNGIVFSSSGAQSLQSLEEWRHIPRMRKILKLDETDVRHPIIAIDLDSSDLLDLVGELVWEFQCPVIVPSAYLSHEQHRGLSCPKSLLKM
jgi:hypothetical protein